MKTTNIKRIISIFITFTMVLTICFSMASLSSFASSKEQKGGDQGREEEQKPLGPAATILSDGNTMIIAIGGVMFVAAIAGATIYSKKKKS